MKAILFGGEHHLDRMRVPDSQVVIKRTIDKVENTPPVISNPDEPVKPIIRAVESYHLGRFFPHGDRAIFLHKPMYNLALHGRPLYMKRARRFKLAWYIIEVPEFRECQDPELVHDILQHYFQNNLT